MFKRALSLFIIACFCLTGCTKKNISDKLCTIEKNKLLKQIDELKENLKIAEYNSYITKLSEKVDLFIKDSDDSYPNYYGGMYVSKDSKNLIIQVVNDNIPTNTNDKEYDKYNKVLNIDDSIKVEYVKNSYNDLNEVNNKIIKYFLSDNTEYSNLNGHYVDIINNTVVVELLDNNKEEQEKFKNLIVDSNLITFVKVKTINKNMLINN